MKWSSRKIPKTKRLVPFQGLTLSQWWHLGLAAILLTYLLIFIINIQVSGFFNYAGLDFRTYYSSAQIALDEGFAQIYDLELQEKYQQPLYDTYRGQQAANDFETVPTPYFPVFVLPFLVFLAFPPHIGFILFTILSGGIFIHYTNHFTKKLGITEERSWIVAGAIGSLALFFNLFYGQINIFLYIALAEFLLALKNKEDFKSGLFLSIWLIKPQMLIFILPWLVATRKFRALAGLGTGSIILVLISTFLAKGDWFTPWIKLLLLYPTGLATTNPLAMMNWRGLALNLEMTVSPIIAWGVAYTGMATTLVFMLRTWKKQTDSNFALPILSAYAATCAITWHAHLHMALPLLAPIMVLLANKKISYKTWIAFIGIQFLALVISFIVQIWYPANSITNMAMLAINVYVTWWSAKKIDMD
jgi:hypothetical protein